MLYTGTQATQRPERMILETLADGTQRLRLADNIREDVTDEGTVYTYDEVLFEVPEDRRVTAESVERDFAAWWEYGAQPEEEITLEQRVSDLEEIIMNLM